MERQNTQFRATKLLAGGPIISCWLYSKIDEETYLSFGEQFEDEKSMQLYGPRMLFGESFLQLWQSISKPLNIDDPSGTDGLSAKIYFKIGHQQVIINGLYDIPTENVVFPDFNEIKVISAIVLKHTLYMI